MATTATQTNPLIAFTLPSTPYSVQMARLYVRAALNRHALGSYADTAELVASELVTNAITHAGGPTFGLSMTRTAVSGAISVTVADLSPNPPVMRPPDDDFEHGRGLHIVAGLSARWGWAPQPPGKAVYAILTNQREAV